MQFFLQAVSDNILVSALEEILGFPLEDLTTVARTTQEASRESVYTIERHNYLYSMHVTIHWSPRVEPRVDNTAAAALISARLKTPVVTDAPSTWPRHESPYVWYLVEPNGERFLVSENIEAGERHGWLEIDDSSRQRIA
jgi:hypothetical protein